MILPTGIPTRAEVDRLLQYRGSEGQKIRMPAILRYAP
jgi:hypothetical protein